MVTSQYIFDKELSIFQSLLIETPGKVYIIRYNTEFKFTDPPSKTLDIEKRIKVIQGEENKRRKGL